MLQCERETDDLKKVVERIVEEIAARCNCMVFVTDPAYRGLINARTVKTMFLMPMYDVSVANAAYTNFIDATDLSQHLIYIKLC